MVVRGIAIDMTDKVAAFWWGPQEGVGHQPMNEPV